MKDPTSVKDVGVSMRGRSVLPLRKYYYTKIQEKVKGFRKSFRKIFLVLLK